LLWNDLAVESAVTEGAPTGSWNWRRGAVGAAVLTILCVAASAWIIEWTDRPQPIRGKWPHMAPLPMVAVLSPAAAFWFVYFARYWRGRARIRERWRPADYWRSIAAYPIKSFLWLVVIVELGLFLLAAACSVSVHS
jgi:hypothetical protein